MDRFNHQLERVVRTMFLLYVGALFITLLGASSAQ
jgi:hypothetical protein